MMVCGRLRDLACYCSKCALWMMQSFSILAFEGISELRMREKDNSLRCSLIVPRRAINFVAVVVCENLGSPASTC
jgi:hypothetical protein